MKKCFKCGAPAPDHEWRVCSDGPYRPVCDACDRDLNELALRWAYPRSWKKKLSAYVEGKKTENKDKDKEKKRS